MANEFSGALRGNRAASGGGGRLKSGDYSSWTISDPVVKKKPIVVAKPVTKPTPAKAPPKPSFQPPALTLGDLKSGSAKATPKPAAATKPAVKPQGPTFTPPKVSVGDITSGKAKAADVKAKAQNDARTNGPADKFNKALKGAANFLTNSEQTVAKPVARLLPGGTNDLKAQNEATAQRDQALKDANKLFVTGKITKPAYQKLLAINNQNADAAVKQAHKTTQTIKNEGDPGHVALGFAGVGLDAMAGGLDDAGKALLKGVDKKVGAKVAGQIAAKTGIKPLQSIADNGVVGAIDKGVSRAGRKVVYTASDLAEKTAPTRAIKNAKDKFMSHWVTELSPLYKTLKRSDFEGRTNGAFEAARSAVGDSNRSLAKAQDYLETNKHIKGLTDSLQSRGMDPIKARKQFDEYAAAKSDKNLVDAGKKTFSDTKVAKLDQTLAKHADKGFDKEYKHMVGAYSDLNNLLYKEGIRSKAVYQQFKDDPFDYIKQQREIPEWMKQKPGGKVGKGSAASITQSQLTKRRNEFASANVLSPYETLVKTVQNAHVEIGRNRAAKTLHKLLSDAGEAKLVKSTDVVREKQAYLKDLKEGKPIVAKQNRIVRTYKKQVGQLQKELDKLNKEGMDVSLGADRTAKGRKDAGAYLNKEEVTNLKRTGKNAPTESSVGLPRNIQGKPVTRLTTAKQLSAADTRKLVNDLVTESPARLKEIRRMIEGRNTKLEPLLDSLETANHDLADLHAHRSEVWNTANSIKSTVDKSNMTSISFLDDGVENVVKVDPAIASAVHNWDSQAQNVMNEFLRNMNQVFKYGTTGLNAGFALPNFVADQVESAINSKAVFATHNPVVFTQTLFSNLGIPLTKNDAKIFRFYNETEGKALSANQYTKPAKTARIANDLVLGKGERAALSETMKEAPVPQFLKGVDRNSKKLYSYIKHPADGGHAAFNGLEDLIGLTERQTRLQNYAGLYKKAIKQGKTEAEAKRLASTGARENSIDFLEMGNYGRVANSFIPYFNAATQGGRIVGRNFVERPVSVAVKTAALVGMPVAASTIWNTTDKKRNAIYKTIPDYLKETNFVVVGPNAKWDDKKKKWDGVFLMKKPQGYKQFAEPLRKFIEFQAQNGKADSLKKFLQEQGASSVAGAASSTLPVDLSSPSRAIGSITPQAGKGIAEDVANHKFYEDQPVVPDNLKNLPAADQHYTRTSQLSTSLAKLFNTSPLKVDQMIKETFGEGGTNIQNTVDHLTTKDPNKIGGRTLPESIQRRFYGAPGGADQTSFYKSYVPAKAQHDSVSKQITKLIDNSNGHTPEWSKANRLADQYNASIEKRFQKFRSQYKDSPTYDTAWDDQVAKLKISKKRIQNASPYEKNYYQQIKSPYAK